MLSWLPALPDLYPSCLLHREALPRPATACTPTPAGVICCGSAASLTGRAQHDETESLQWWQRLNTEMPTLRVCVWLRRHSTLRCRSLSHGCTRLQSSRKSLCSCLVVCMQAGVISLQAYLHPAALLLRHCTPLVCCPADGVELQLMLRELCLRLAVACSQRCMVTPWRRAQPAPAVDQQADNSSADSCSDQ